MKLILMALWTLVASCGALIPRRRPVRPSVPTAFCGPVTIFDVAPDGTLSNPVRADVMIYRGENGNGTLQQIR